MTTQKKNTTKKTAATNPVDEDLASRNKKIESKTAAPKATDSQKKGGDWGMIATLIFLACICVVLIFVAIKLVSGDDNDAQSVAPVQVIEDDSSTLAALASELQVMRQELAAAKSAAATPAVVQTPAVTAPAPTAPVVTLPETANVATTPNGTLTTPTFDGWEKVTVNKTEEAIPEGLQGLMKIYKGFSDVQILDGQEVRYMLTQAPGATHPTYTRGPLPPAEHFLPTPDGFVRFIYDANKNIAIAR